MKIKRSVGACVLALLSVFGSTAPASADDRVTLGGGSQIVVVGEKKLACTLTTIGHDSNGDVVGLTAGHCGELGDAVLSETEPGAGTLGIMVKKNPKLDFAVIKFNPGRVIPTATVSNLTITGISTDQPAVGQVACKLGRTTGWTCGMIWKSDRINHVTQICIAQGDSGAPVVEGSTLVAMVNVYYFDTPCAGPEGGTNIGPILDAIGPGVGEDFEPEPAD